MRKTQSTFLAFVFLCVASWISFWMVFKQFDPAIYPLKLGWLWKINYQRV